MIFWIKLLPPSLEKKLEAQQSLQLIAKNTGWLFADNILRLAVGFLVGIAVTRSLGPEQFGLLNYSISLVTFFSPIALLGLDGIVVRNLSKDKSRRDEILGSAFVMMIVGGFTGVFLASVSVAIIRPADHHALLLVAIMSLGLIFQACLSIDFWLQSQVQSKYCAVPRIIVMLMNAMVKLGLVSCNAPLIAFVWAGVAETALGSMEHLLVYRTYISRIRNWLPTMRMSLSLIGTAGCPWLMPTIPNTPQDRSNYDQSNRLPENMVATHAQ